MISLAEATIAFDIVSYLSQFTEVKDNGATNVYCRCPICQGDHKLGINRVTKLASCFKCREPGSQTVWKGTANLVGLVMLFEQLKDYKQALEVIYKFSGYSLAPTQQAFPTIPKNKIPKEAIPLSKAGNHKSVLYMAGRGMSHLNDISYVCVEGRYRGRIILPGMFFDELYGFEAKAYEPIKPKSLFPEWFKTGEYLYTTRKWDRKVNYAILTESIFDAETFGTNAFGLYGSGLSESQLNLLLSIEHIDTLIWCLDNDAFKKSFRLMMQKTSHHFANKIIWLGDGEDPNAIGREECWRRFHKAVLIKDEFDLITLGIETGQDL